VAPGQAALELSNDGTVLDRVPAGAGNGLAGLAERAGLLGGALTAGPTEAGGYRLRVSVPV
jgi:signal transduction histidine kinase